MLETVRPAQSATNQREENTMAVKDPVCGMRIEKEDAVARVEYEGKAYYFCSEDCRTEFEASPEDYADEGGEVE